LERIVLNHWKHSVLHYKRSCIKRGLNLFFNGFGLPSFLGFVYYFIMTINYLCLIKLLIETMSILCWNAIPFLWVTPSFQFVMWINIGDHQLHFGTILDRTHDHLMDEIGLVLVRMASCPIGLNTFHNMYLVLVSYSRTFTSVFLDMIGDHLQVPLLVLLVLMQINNWWRCLKCEWWQKNRLNFGTSLRGTCYHLMKQQLTTFLGGNGPTQPIP
jgi:hypothetical protein